MPSVRVSVCLFEKPKHPTRPMPFSLPVADLMFRRKTGKLNSKFHRYKEISVGSRQILQHLGQISKDMEEYWPDLSRSDEISAKIRPDLTRSDKILSKIRPDFDPGNEPETNRDAPETDKTRSGRSEAPYGSVAGYDFSHPSLSGRVRVGHKLDPDRPVDTPTCGDISVGLRAFTSALA